MTDPSASPPTHPLEMILRLCAGADPQPWYPKDHAASTGTNRDQLDPPLERLRLAGLIRLTDWVKDHGQGYVLTPEGKQALQNSRELSQLSNGRVPAPRAPVEPAAGPEVPRAAWDRGGIILDELQRPQTAVVTNFLLAANIVWFLAGMLLARHEAFPVGLYLSNPPVADNPQARDVLRQYNQILHDEGALSGADLVHGQWWRLLTCCFVHIGVIHIGVNMLTLVMVGPMLERMWGRLRLLAIYLIAGWGGSCIVMIVEPRTQVAGASGALWGIVASAAVWIMLNRAYLPPALSSAWLRNLLVAFMINAVISMAPNISASAHFGGGAIGAVAGVLAHFQRFGAVGRRRLGLAGLVLLPGLCFAALAGDMATSPRWRQLATRYETVEFKEEAGDLALGAGNDALRAVEKILPLITEYAPQRRNLEDVQRARTTLEERLTELDQTAARLGKVGPYRTVAVEQARQAGIAYIQGVIELCRQAQTCLQGGENWKQEEKVLTARWNQSIELRTAWLKAGRQAGQSAPHGRE